MTEPTDPIPAGNLPVPDATEGVETQKDAERIWVPNPYSRLPRKKWYSVLVPRLEKRRVVNLGVKPEVYIGLAILALFLLIGPIVLVKLSSTDIEMRTPPELTKKQPEKDLPPAKDLGIRFFDEQHQWDAERFK